MISAVEVLRVLDARDDEVGAQAKRLGIVLRVDELRRLAEQIGRDPTVVEAHAFDAQWSEHCSYKSSRIHLSRLPGATPDVILGPGEDAGIVRLGTYNGDTYGVVIAHESHNHPSQVVPFEGAATGVGGVVRDVLCMGAELIGIADPLRLGPRDDAYSRYVAQGVVDGVAAYGNAIGVPNLGGDTFFHPGFRENVLVNVIALGLVKEQDVIRSSAPQGSAGWDIVLVGKATDRSGFGGAAFSSLVLDDADAQANKGAVQVPDPFLKSVLMRASYRVFEELRARNVTAGFKDLGAGGIMGCTAELVAAGRLGATIDLDRVPVALNGLAPAVIAVGETQERMAWIVPPEATPALLAIYNEEFTLPQIARGACAAVIGTVSSERDYVLRYGGEEVMRVPVEVLTAGVRYERDHVARRALDSEPPSIEPRLADAESDWSTLLDHVLAHPDVCARKEIYERYDGVVRGVTSLAPGEAAAGVVAPIPGSTLGVALAVGGNPRLGRVDARQAAEHAVYEAVRGVVAVGARPAALSDCLNFGNPEIPEQMGELIAGIDGLAHAARSLGLAYVTGNVSLYNESANGAAIPASPIVSCVGVLDDVSIAVPRRLKRAGSSLYFVGHLSHALGGAVVADLVAGGVRAVSRIDFERVAREHAFVLEGFARSLILGAQPVGDGGLVMAVLKMAFDTLSDEPVGVALERFDGWFSEGGGLVLEVADTAAFEDRAAAAQVEPRLIGTTIAEPDFVALEARREVRRPLRELYERWTAPLASFYEDA